MSGFRTPGVYGQHELSADFIALADSGSPSAGSGVLNPGGASAQFARADAPAGQRGPSGASTTPAEETYSEEEILLAAMAYGEASTGDVAEEMYAIANALVHQRDCRKYATISALTKGVPSYSFVISDGNARYAKFNKATAKARAADKGMNAALAGAKNALSSSGTDYSNGAYFWDGADLKTNTKHAKRVAGLKFTDAAHDIYALGDLLLAKPVVVNWLDKNGKATKERGRYDHVWESTAAYGGTVFWRKNADYMKATGENACK